MLPRPVARTATVGDLIDERYEIRAPLGQGGMGAVFHVVDTATGRELALKRLRGDADGDTGRERSELWFRREFHTVARLRHPSIVEVYDFGFDRGRPYYTMELLVGPDPSEIARSDVLAGCKVLRDVASALAFLHARRLLHRDLKGRNVRCTASGGAKLLDFGVLATMGVVGDVAGTPPAIPPESLRGLPLDGRADLFGLGVLAYWLLTGRHAYPARDLSDLEGAWRRRPVPLSQLRPDTPAGLEELVHSLVSVDRAGRPGTAAEVIDRLDAIAGLEADPEMDVARGWLLSASLIGREQEMDCVRRALNQATLGVGSVLIVRAPSGMGKTRLLREAGLEAQLAGATVLSAKGSPAAGPFAVTVQLIEAALKSCRADAVQALRPHASIIGRVAPQVLEVTRARLHLSRGDPSEDRFRLQAALSAWFRDLARRRQLLIEIDELQRCDEASAALLASLGHVANHSTTVIMAAMRNDEPITAPTAVGRLLDVAQVLSLEGLDRIGVTALVATMFGEVRHAERVVDWMHRLGAGSPMHCMELARYLVEQSIIRYAEGMWLLAGDLVEEALPHELSRTMDLRVTQLGPRARELGEILAVLGGRVSLESCAEVSKADAETLFEALDELVFREVVIADSRGIELRHDGLREALLRGTGAARRRELHRRAAQCLDHRTEQDPLLQERIGWHFVYGGEPVRGAERLEAAGRQLYDAYSFTDAVAPLEEALRIYEQHARHARRHLDLRSMLMRAGVICNRDIVLRYAEETIAAYHRQSGLSAAQRLQAFVGSHVGLLLGVGWAFLVWIFTGMRRASPIEALTQCFTMTNYAATVYSQSFATDSVRRMVDLLSPLKVLRRRVPEVAYLLTQNFLWMPLGRFGRVFGSAGRSIEVLNHDRLSPIRDLDRRFALGAAHFMISSGRALRQDPVYEDSIAELESLDLQFFTLAAQMARVYFHRMRGEEPRARALEDATQVLFIQLGNAWVFESHRAWTSSIAYGSIDDVLGLKNSMEELERLIAAGYSLQGFARLAQGEYLRARGDTEAARAVLEDALPRVPADHVLLRQITAAALVETLVADDAWDQAAVVASEVLAALPDVEDGLYAGHLRLARGRALAWAGQGDLQRAGAELDRLLADDTPQLRPLLSPLLKGLLHEARAWVAQRADDHGGYLWHATEGERHFASTENSVLLARGRRLLSAIPPLAEAGAIDTAAADSQTAPLAITSGDSQTDHDSVTVVEHPDVD